MKVAVWNWKDVAGRWVGPQNDWANNPYVCIAQRTALNTVTTQSTFCTSLLAPVLRAASSAYTYQTQHHACDRRRERKECVVDPAVLPIRLNSRYRVAMAHRTIFVIGCPHKESVDRNPPFFTVHHLTLEQ